MVIYKCYLRFCASINFFFERVRNDDDPGIPALLFVTVLFSVYSYGFFYSVELFIGKEINIHKSFFFGVFVLWGLLNYFLAFRKERLYKYYENKLRPSETLLFIILGYVFMGITGYYSRLL